MTIPSPGEQQSGFNQPLPTQINSISTPTAGTRESLGADYQGLSTESIYLVNGSNQGLSTARMSSVDSTYGQSLDNESPWKAAGPQSILKRVSSGSVKDSQSVGLYGNGSIFGPVFNGESAGPISPSQPLNQTTASPTTAGASGFLTTPQVQPSKPLALVTSGVPQTPSTSVSSSPPFQPSALRQRHTLQVPVSTNKNLVSTGSLTDTAAVTTGRFSPTTATAPRRASMSLGRRGTRSMDNYVNEIPQDEDAAKAAEAIIAKRASKRRRKEEEEDDKVLVGTKVDINHANWITAYNMLTGIRFVVRVVFPFLLIDLLTSKLQVSRINAKMFRQLTDADFDAKHKFSFDMSVSFHFLCTQSC